MRTVIIIVLILSGAVNFGLLYVLDSERTKRIELEAEGLWQKQMTEYTICQYRGHEKGTIYLTNPPIYECRWCGTEYKIDVIQEITKPNRIDSED